MTGDELRTLRLAMGLTQTQLGYLLHYGQQAMTLFETGARRIPYYVARRLYRIASVWPTYMPEPYVDTTDAA